MQERTAWASGITVIVLGGGLSGWPQPRGALHRSAQGTVVYIGISTGILGALGGVILTFIRANEVSEE
ncbi:MAG: hypothetical protein ACR2FE_07315 [Aeromicrobium sp.]